MIAPEQRSATRPLSPPPERVFVVGGLELPPDPDDSYAVLLDQLTRRLRRVAATEVFTCGHAEAIGGSPLPRARLLSRTLAHELWRQRPDLILYIYPPTLPALCRARLMSFAGGGARVIMVAPQPVRWRRATRPLVRRLWPESVLVPSPAELEECRGVGPAATYATGVDVARFRPALPGEKEMLRRRWGLPEDKRVVLHVGHLVPSRNLSVLCDLASIPGLQPVVAISRFRVAESADIEARLRRSGVVIFSGYQPHVEELYRLADCYVFPVRSPQGALAMPLSVLEALASDVPVAGTPFGVLPELFEGAPGVAFAESDADLVLAVQELLGRPVSVRRLAEPHSWDAAVAQVLEHCGFPAF